MSSRVATPRVCAVRYEDGSTELFPFHEAQDRLAKAADGGYIFSESADISKIRDRAK